MKFIIMYYAHMKKSMKRYLKYAAIVGTCAVFVSIPGILFAGPIVAIERINVDSFPEITIKGDSTQTGRNTDWYLGQKKILPLWKIIHKYMSLR